MDNVYIPGSLLVLPIALAVRDSKGLSEEPQRFLRFPTPKKQTQSPGFGRKS